MGQQTINVGTAPDDGTGDPVRTAFTKCNANFTELYTAGAGGNVSNSGTPVANDVAQWVTATTIKGVPLATWRTTPTFYGVMSIRTAALDGGLDISPFSSSTLIAPEGTNADLGLAISSKGNGALTLYNASFGRVCAQFTSAPGTNTFPTFTGNVNYCELASNPTGNPIVFGSVAKLKGVTDGSDAAAGEVGEYLEQTGTAALSASTFTAIASKSFTAGDWDVWAAAEYYTGASGVRAFISVSGSASAFGALGNTAMTVIGSSLDAYPCTSPVRISITSTTTIYAVALSDAAVTTVSAKLAGRRVR